jgi:UDP-N-acetylmuramoyl-tripeptide--D-alanyl-D-alanine ligase
VEVTDSAAAARYLQEEVRPGDVVLVKASRAAGLETLAGVLAADRAAAQ